MSRNRSGRPRKEGPRYPNGELRPPGANAWLVLRRAELSGDPSLGSPQDALGICVARGLITRTDRDAGIKYDGALRRWSRIVGNPSRTLLTRETGRPVKADPKATAEARALAAWNQARQALEFIGELEKATVELVAIEGIYFTEWHRPAAIVHPGVLALRRGLEALKKHFGLVEHSLHRRAA